VLLQFQDRIFLTGLPVAHESQMESPCVATRRELAAGVKPRPLDFDLPGGLSGTVEPARDDVSCYVVVAFGADGHGEIVGFGPGSISVTENG
jgi:hypothetical protein